MVVLEPISDDALEEEWYGLSVDRDDLRRERGWSDWDGGAPMRMRLLPFAVLLFSALPPPSAAQSPVGLPGRFTGLHGLTAGGRRIRTRGPSAKGKVMANHSRQALLSRA